MSKSLFAAAIVKVRAQIRYQFGSEEAGTNVGTGFVVDEKLGLVLTCKHIVGAGLSHVTLEFASTEKTKALLVYVDPENDFAVVQYDPGNFKYTEVIELELCPTIEENELVHVMTDKNAYPNTVGDINIQPPGWDWNIPYFRLHSKTSPGTSGSPAVNSSGRAVGMLCSGGKKGATCLTLDRVIRVLQQIQQQKVVPRGTIWADFHLVGFGQCEELGVTAGEIADVRNRKPYQKGLLVVQSLISNGTAGRDLMVGDVLLQINDIESPSLHTLGQVFDDNVDKLITICFARGKKREQISLTVEDLARYLPTSFLVYGGVTFYQVHPHEIRELRQVSQRLSVSDPNGALFSDRSFSRMLLYKVNGKDITNLDDLRQQLRGFADEAMTLTFEVVKSSFRKFQTKTVTFKKLWTGTPQIYVTKGNQAGDWDRQELELRKLVALDVPVETSARRIGSSEFAAQVSKSLVVVTCKSHIRVDRCEPRSQKGFGIIVDEPSGLVLVTRALVPHRACVVTVNIGSVDLDVEIVDLQCVEGYVMIQYRANDVKADLVNAKFPETQIKPGSSITMIGFDSEDTIFETWTTITDCTACNVETHGYSLRPTHCLTLGVDTLNAQNCYHGVIIDDQGRFISLWQHWACGRQAGFLCGIPLCGKQTMLRSSALRQRRAIGFELATISIPDARHRGLPKEYLPRDEAGKELSELLTVRFVQPLGPHNAQALKTDDLILSVNGCAHADTARFGDAVENQKECHLRIWRDNAWQDIQVATHACEAFDTSHLFVFGGAVFQQVPFCVRQNHARIASDIFIGQVSEGSDMCCGHLIEDCFVTHFDGLKIDSISQLILKVQQASSPSFTMTVETLQGEQSKCCICYHSVNDESYEYTYKGTGWEKRRIIFGDSTSERA